MSHPPLPRKRKLPGHLAHQAGRGTRKAKTPQLRRLCFWIPMLLRYNGEGDAHCKACAPVGRGAEREPELLCDLACEVEAHAGGLALFVTGVTGEALFKYIRKVACAHARPVVTDGEDGLGRAARERKREYRRIARVFHAVAHELPEQETQPAPVGEYGLVRKPDLDPEALFLQQRTVIVEHLVDAAA